jgi:hypothetical protein
MDFAGVRVSPGSTVVRGIAQGAVTAGKTVTVRIAGTDVVCLAARDLTTAAGDIVVGLRQPGQVVILARLFASAPSAPDESTGIPTPEPSTRSGTLTVKPKETRSYRSGGWRNDMDDLFQSVWGGDVYTGCAFYGTSPRSLAGSTVTGIRLKLKRLRGGDSSPRTPTLWKVTQSSRPAGAPTRTGSSTDGPLLSVNETNDFALPVAWGQALVDGTIGGLAIYVPTDSDPHVKLAGRGSWAYSMIINIDWTRTS